MSVSFDIQVAHEESSAELLHKRWFTVAEICELFRFSPIVVRMAARHGELRAIIIDHHVYGARRENLLAWLKERAAQ
jgi:hypothetical protein